MSTETENYPKWFKITQTLRVTLGRVGTKTVCFCGSKNAQTFWEGRVFDAVKMQNVALIRSRSQKSQDCGGQVRQGKSPLRRNVCCKNAKMPIILNLVHSLGMT